jgi:hypothetical protein
MDDFFVGNVAFREQLEQLENRRRLQKWVLGLGFRV